MTDTVSMTPPGPSPEPAIDVEGLHFAYPGASAPSLEGITLRVPHGERLGILGPNGGGKSTLLKLTLGLLRPSAGSVRVCGLHPVEARRRQLIGYVPQRSDADLQFPLSVRQVVLMGAGWRRAPWRSPSEDVLERVDKMIELVGASSYAARPIGKLSGGQFQRALIARALAADPKILALDEPTVGIDAAGQQEFATLLERVHAASGATILIVSHDLRAIAAGCDRVACLRRTLHAHTSPEGLTPAVLAEVFSHDVAGIFGDVHVDAHLAAGCSDPSHHAGHTHEVRPSDRQEPA